MDLNLKTRKKWTLDRVQKKLQKAGLSVAGDKITDESFSDLLMLFTAFGNTVTIGFTLDNDGDTVARGLAFNYGKPPKGKTGWYPMSKEKNAKEFEAMSRFAELIGGVPVYWRVNVAENRGT